MTSIHTRRDRLSVARQIKGRCVERSRCGNEIPYNLAFPMTISPAQSDPQGRQWARSEMSARIRRTASCGWPLIVAALWFMTELRSWGHGWRGLIIFPVLLLALFGARVPRDARWAAVVSFLGSSLLIRTGHLGLLLGVSASSLGALYLALRAGSIAIASTMHSSHAPSSITHADSTDPSHAPGSVALAPSTRLGHRASAALLIWGSVCFTLLLCESALLLVRSSGLVQSRWILPREFEVRRAGGKDEDYWWHGVLHRFNKQGFRGKDLPETAALPRDHSRIIVLGDSLTYGYAVSEDETYPRLIERLLGPSWRVEVLNLGVSGYQSEEVLELARTYVPRLKPDLVIYGHCLNDFLPADIGNYSHYDLPLPDRLKTLYRRETLIGGLTTYGYAQLLIRLGLENDFYDDILKGIVGYEPRFARDVHELNELARKATAQPVLAMVLNAHPDIARGRELARIAERRMREGGMLVVPAEPYEDEYARSGVPLFVSIWEGHPNALANSVFAREIVAAMRADPGIRKLLDRFPASPAGEGH